MFGPDATGNRSPQVSRQTAVDRKGNENMASTSTDTTTGGRSTGTKLAKNMTAGLLFFTSSETFSGPASTP